MVFSSSKATALKIDFADALIQPASDQATVAQIAVAGPKLVDVRAQRGALQFSYHGETETIPEGSAYRVVLDPTETDETNLASRRAFSDQKPPARGGRRRKGFLFLPLGGAGIATGIAIHGAFVSPDKP